MKVLNEVFKKHLITKEVINMITISPVKFNNTRKYISFGEGSNLNNVNSKVGLMSLDKNSNTYMKQKMQIWFNQTLSKLSDTIL